MLRALTLAFHSLVQTARDMKWEDFFDLEIRVPLALGPVDTLLNVFLSF